MSNSTAKIVIRNTGETAETTAGITLFKALRDANIFVPTICGGKGFCGKCRIQIFSGNTSPVTESEKKKLTDEDFAQGWRLSCQALVEGDMEIELPQDTKDVRLYKAEVVALEMVCRETRRVRLRLMEPPTMEYLPGAFILLDIPPTPEKKQGASRAYSIATPPSSKNEIELNVKHVPGGFGSGYVHNVLKLGDMASFSAPYSGYPQTCAVNDLICIAGGSGISPVLSILRHMKETDCTRRTKFFFGVRECDDLEYIPELRTMEKELEAFEFFSIVENPGNNADEKILVGRVTDAVARIVNDATGCSAYLCGGKGMLDACCRILVDLGIKQEDIFFDQFS